MNEDTGVLMDSPGKVYLLWFWVEWVLASTLGAALSSFLVASGVIFTAGASLFLAGPLVGVSVGWAQERVLRSRFPGANWSHWAQRTLIGMSLAWFTVVILYVVIAILDGFVFHGIFRSNQLALLAILLIGGSMILGLIQGEALKGWHGTRWWLISNVIGCVIAAIGSISITNLFLVLPEESMLLGFPEAIYFFVAGTLSVLLLSALTGITMVLLVQNRPVTGLGLPRKSVRAEQSGPS